jgi:hypothetical protein
MNLITRTNQKTQKTIVFLKKAGEGFFAASLVLISYEPNNKVTRHLIGTQKITAEQLAELYAEQLNLNDRGIYIINVDEETATSVILLDGISNIFDLENAKPAPSPYFNIIVDLFSFFSTQKTRGPNKSL